MNPLMRKAIEDGEFLLALMDARAYERRERHKRLRVIEHKTWSAEGGYYRSTSVIVGINPPTKRKAKSKVRL